MKTILLSVMMVLVGLSLSSCNKTPNWIPNAEVNITVEEIGENYVVVTFTPNKHSTGFKFAIGRISDLTAFNNGTFERIIDVNNGKVKRYTFENLSTNTEYTIFVSGIKTDGTRNETSRVKVVPIYPHSVNVDFTTISTSRVDVIFTPNEFCTHYFFVGVYKNEWDNLVKTEIYEERLDKMIKFVKDNGITQTTNGYSAGFLVNGYSNQEILILILSYDAQNRPAYQEVYLRLP